MYKEHQARFSQLPRHLPVLLRAQFSWEGLFEVNLAASPAEAGNAFRFDRGYNSIPVPPFSYALRAEENVILIIGVIDLVSWWSDTQGGTP